MQTLSARSLEIPECDEAIAFRAVTKVLRNDATLQAVIRTFLSQSDNHQELQDPTHALCPYLRLDPGPIESRWVTERQHKMDMMIEFTLAVAGLDVIPLMNMWAAIRRAIIPQEQAQFEQVSQVLRTAGVIRPEVTINAYSSPRDGEALRFRVAGGRIRFAMNINT